MHAGKGSTFYKLAIDAFKELNANDPLRLAGATAFFTLFALPPILVIITQVFGLLFDPETIRSQLTLTLSGIVGIQSVEQIMSVLKSIRTLAGNWFITISGFIFLLFVATTLFKVIRSSLNQLWKVRVTVHRNFKRSVTDRFRAITIILLAGVLFLGGILAETIQALLGKYVSELSLFLATYFNIAFTQIVSLIIVTTWFAVLFHHLPDGKPTWKVALMGGLVTSLLFNLGKLILRYLLAQSNLQTIYGASGSVILLLLFIFYASLIFYYGAAFTKIWGIHIGKPIMPHHHAVNYEILTSKNK